MRRYLIAYKTWDDYESERVERVNVIDNERDAIDIVAKIISNNSDEIISITDFNFYSQQAKKLEVQLNKNMKLELKEVSQ
ncbi:hypothetical protein KQI46_08900 [Lysinibacillus capsici]|uniref:hypothetical protein n=1 Tax=Lysinibacillus capsici TaxID=2115968 RepID=UPI001C11D631|nr:hypothetical protein [Lysinibacillus capsici]MBU5252056.1 hypothetical protein [Lysinibacillus capsici]